jgi:hypothetical protein
MTPCDHGNHVFCIEPDCTCPHHEEETTAGSR